MQRFLESLGQHCTGFSAVQCYPKSITTTMNRIFSSAKLSGASRTTLHRVFTCAMLFGASLTTLHRVIICAILSQEYLLGQRCIVKTLCSAVLEAPENIA